MQEIEHLERYKFFFQIFLFLVFLSSLNFSQRFPFAKVDELLTNGIASMNRGDYSLAEKYFLELRKDYANLPFGDVYLAAVEITRASDFGIEINKNKINNYLESATQKANALYEQNENDLWNRYAMALTEGYWAYFEALQKDWIDAFAKGTSSINYFEECLEINKNFSEAFIALGTYKYWRSRKTESLTWLPFINDERKEGIEFLEKASRKNSYNRVLAINSLIWIYVDRKENAKAEQLANEAVKLFPGNRFLLWAAARVYEASDPTRSIAIYNDLLREYSELKLESRVRPIIARHKIAQMHFRLGNKIEAMNNLNEIPPTIELTENEKKVLGSRLERIENFRTKVESSE